MFPYIFTPSPAGDEAVQTTKEILMKRVKKVNYKAQKKYFAKTSAMNSVEAVNSRPAPQRGGFRM